jgi:hypothetical protein
MTKSPIELYAQVISEQARKERGYVSEDKMYAMDYDEPTKKQESALAKAHAHIKSKGYTISHDGSDNPKHKEHKNPDITYHYAMGDDQHHAFTVHKNGKAANDKELHNISKHLDA